MLLRSPLDGFKAHAHTSGGWVNFWKNAGVGGYHMRQPTLTITRLIKVSVTLSFTNSCIMVTVTNLLNHVDILWRWEHLPETFPYQYLPFQLFFGQKRVTHAHVPLAPTPPSSFVSVTATLEPLVDHSCSGSQWMHHRHPHPGVGGVTHRGLSSQHYCTQQTHRWQHASARAVLVGRFAGRSRASARDNGKRAEESLRMGASARQAFCVGWVIQFPSYHLVSLDMLDTATHPSFLHTLW